MPATPTCQAVLAELRRVRAELQAVRLDRANLLAAMQPMMVISTGDPLPEVAIVVISRLVWRYRSELAPAAVAAGLASAGWWAHAAYPGAVVLAGGAWLALAAALGPLTPPLPSFLGIGAVVLSVPWWAHRRRRARVRVERTLAAWPDIPRAVGLAGSAVMSATVDVWGWRARFRLARGQTITDVIGRGSRDRVRAWHLPGRGPRLPDAR